MCLLSSGRFYAALLRRVFGFGLGGLLLLSLTIANAGTHEKPMCLETTQQVRMVADDKASRTPAQRKISSELLGLQGKRGGIELQPDGTVSVDIKATVTDTLLKRIEALGGIVMSSFPQYQAIRARIPATRLEALADSPDVRFIRPADQFQLH